MRAVAVGGLLLAVLAAAVGCADGGSSRRGGYDGGGARVDASGGADAGTGMRVDAAGMMGVDAGGMMGSDAGPPMDAGYDAGYDAGRDAGHDAGYDAGAGCVGAACTVSFPTAPDTRFTMLTNFWNAGDYVQGARTTTVPSIAGLSMHLVLEAVSLTCDTQDARVLVNGVEVGRFSARSGGAPVDASFVFARVTGPTYTFRYETVRTVAGGCGSAGYSNTGSTITLVP